MDAKVGIQQHIATNALLFHGFSGAPSDVEPIQEMLQAYDWNCHAPLLPGHDQQFEGLRDVDWHEWLDKAEEEAVACTARYGTFSVIGFSMGGLLAAYIANRYPVERVVLLNAAVFYFSPLRYISYFWESLRRRNFAHFRRASRIPHQGVKQFMKMAGELRGEFHHIRQPTLICQAGRDQIVHPRSAIYLRRVIPGPTEMVVFPRSKHVICWDVEQEQVVDTVKKFLIDA